MKNEKKEAKKSGDAALKAETKALRERLLAQQQQIREAKLPIIVLIEGWSAAGKGSLINELISEIDPRFYNVTSPVIVPETEERYPFLYPFAKAIPENGKIMFMDSGAPRDHEGRIQKARARGERIRAPAARRRLSRFEGLRRQ